MNDDFINKVFTAIPCLSCEGNWRADFVKARLGAFYLAMVAENNPPVPPLSELCKGCCKHADEWPDNSITLLSLSPHGKTTFGSG